MARLNGPLNVCQLRQKYFTVLTVGPIAGKDLCASDVRLESFVAYLLKNGFAPQARVVELAALEQFAHPGLESNDATIAKFRKTAETFLNQVSQVFSCNGTR